MRTLFLYIALAVTCLCSRGQSATHLASKRVRLPNGWSLTPAGTNFKLGDLPLNLVLSGTGRWAAVTNNGQSTQSIQLIDVKAEKVASTVIVPKAWYGLKFTADEKF